MKIAILCLAIYVHVAYTSEGSREPVAQHAEHENLSSQGYIPYNSNQTRPDYSPPPQYYYTPQPQPRQRKLFDLRNPLHLYILLRALTPKTTTAATTMASTTTAAPDQLAGWTQVGNNNCYYRLSTDTLNWNDAKAKCEETEGGRLAVVGFNAPTADRQALIKALDAVGLTFWIGVDGTVSYFVVLLVVGTAEFIAPLDGIDVTNTIPGFYPVISDTSGDTDPVCGRVDGAHADRLQFEACDVEERRYLCEICI